MESFLDKIKRAQASGDRVFVYRDGVEVDPESIPDGEALVDFYEKFENKRVVVLRGDTLTVATYMALFGRKFCQRVIVFHDGFYLNTCFPSPCHMVDVFVCGHCFTSRFRNMGCFAMPGCVGVPVSDTPQGGMNGISPPDPYPTDNYWLTTVQQVSGSARETTEDQYVVSVRSRLSCEFPEVSVVTLFSVVPASS